VTSIEEIRLAAGNEQLLAICNRRDELIAAIDLWEDTAKRIEKRWPTWEKLGDLLRHAGSLQAAEEARQQAEAIEKQRLLLAEPDPIQPLLKSLEDALRAELTLKQKQYGDAMASRTSALDDDASWQQLAEDEREAIRGQCGITDAPALSLGTHQELVSALERHPLVVWRDRIDALPGRFDRAREQAARSLEPETQTVDIPRRTLKSPEDVDAWIKDVQEQLKNALAKGPVVIR
jgi:tetratricopeptide (TPR) repeat protein